MNEPMHVLPRSHQIELIDQFILFGFWVAGIVLLNPQRGTPLSLLLLLLRTAAGRVISASVALLEAALEAVGVPLG